MGFLLCMALYSGADFAQAGKRAASSSSQNICSLPKLRLYMEGSRQNGKALRQPFSPFVFAHENLWWDQAEYQL